MTPSNPALFDFYELLHCSSRQFHRTPDVDLPSLPVAAPSQESYLRSAIPAAAVVLPGERVVTVVRSYALVNRRPPAQSDIAASQSTRKGAIRALA